jgi:hypothetical protein
VIDTENGLVLLDRVTDRSWLKSTTAGPPPEYAPAMFGLDHAVCEALAADWTPEEIANEVRQLLESRSIASSRER